MQFQFARAQQNPCEYSEYPCDYSEYPCEHTACNAFPDRACTAEPV